MTSRYRLSNSFLCLAVGVARWFFYYPTFLLFFQTTANHTQEAAKASMAGTVDDRLLL